MGQLLYIANKTRPNITNATCELGKVSADPTMRHWKSPLHTFRYLSNTAKCGLLHPKNTSKRLDSDVDFTGDETTRISRTGDVIKLGEAAIQCVSRTQRAIVTSTTEAEWTALNEGARHGVCIRGLLSEIRLHQKRITWWCDNASTIIRSNLLNAL